MPKKYNVHRILIYKIFQNLSFFYRFNAISFKMIFHFGLLNVNIATPLFNDRSCLTTNPWLVNWVRPLVGPQNFNSSDTRGDFAQDKFGVQILSQGIPIKILECFEKPTKVFQLEISPAKNISFPLFLMYFPMASGKKKKPINFPDSFMKTHQIFPLQNFPLRDFSFT